MRWSWMPVNNSAAARTSGTCQEPRHPRPKQGHESGVHELVLIRDVQADHSLSSQVRPETLGQPVPIGHAPTHPLAGFDKLLFNQT